MKKIGMMVMGLALMAVAAVAQESKYSTSSTGTDPAVTFSPKNGRQTVSSMQTSCDVALGAVKFYTRAGKYAITATNTATLITIANTALAVNTNDIVVWVHANGTIEKDTIAGPITTTNVILTTGNSTAWASGDYLYEVTLAHQIVVADNTAAARTNKLADFQGDIFAVPGDSPLYVVMDGATNTCLSITVK